MNEVKVTVPMINCLLSAAAERGDLGRAGNIFLEFDNYRLEPNADSFCFVFEAIGKHIRANRPRKQVFRERNMAALIATARSFVERMEKLGIAANKEILRNYIEILIATGQQEKANSIVFGARDTGAPLNSKTIYRVAMMNARAQKFDIAYQMARIRSPVSDVLCRNITGEEARHGLVCSSPASEASTASGNCAEKCDPNDSRDPTVEAVEPDAASSAVEAT